MTLIKELIDIPESVQRGDFVLKLSEGVERPEETLRDYVVTPELAAHFDEALAFIQSALHTNTSKASYLHGSFGSGKSHFMAVLNLLLRGEPRARSIPELAAVVAKHNPWSLGRKFLLVPYHMIGAPDMESGILGGYVDFIRRVHPEAPIPGVYLAEGLFRDAGGLRQKMGDAAFFAALNEGAAVSDGWGELAAAWDPDRFESAAAAPPGSEERAQLISALISRFFGSYDLQAGGRGEAFLSLDKGLSVISRHAQALGYDAIILFLDELILWLASHAADLKFVHQEGQKLAKLVEAQTADRPVPVISFVARQRDLRELIGDAVPGADRLNFSDSLGHWEGRFHRITLEDRNLPAIAEKRILKCRSEGARRELDASFDQVARMRDSVMTTLLTNEGDRAMFRKVYPFSPALMQTLIAVSTVLQRERTALKVMMQLLVDQRDTLKLGDIVPVGDLFDVIAHGDEAFSPEMAIHFDNARRLYHQKLLPLLERQHGRSEELERLPYEDPQRAAFRADARLVKTLLLAALVPQVETLRALNAERLAALNHGSIKTPIPGREAQEALRRCREWAANVGEIRVGEEHNPTISVQLSGVDTETIIAQARGEDSLGNRMRRVRQMLYEQLDIQGQDSLEQQREFWWKNTKRSSIVLCSCIRELPDASLENDEERWKLVIGYPFDEAGHGPRDGLSKLQAFQAAHAGGARTLCWSPSFLSQDALKDLGLLVILDHILAGMRFDQYAVHLSPQDRQAAKSLLENQRNILTQRVRNHIDAAYGLEAILSGSLDAAFRLETQDQFVSLSPGFEQRPPVAASLKQAMEALLGQALAYEFPAAPEFDAEVRSANLNKVLPVALEAAQARDGRVAVDRTARALLRQIANPLLLGEMGADATHFVLQNHWKDHFHRKQAETGRPLEVRHLRRWIDEPRPMGLPREAQNLVILLFAAQTGRTFYRHNIVVEPTPANLADDCELREPRLPDEAQWNSAVTRAESLFGLTLSPLRNAANVETLAAQVRSGAEAARANCQRYSERLRDRLTGQGIAYSDAERMKTALAVVELVEQICARNADVVGALAGARIATSETAMRECLQKAPSLAAALTRAQWGLFEGVGRLTGSWQAEAMAVRQDVERALSSDEHVVPLESALEDATERALRLLTQAAAAAAPPSTPTEPPAAPRAPQPQRPHAGRHRVSDGAREALDIATTLELISGLEAEARAGRRVRISVQWVVETDEAAS